MMDTETTFNELVTVLSRYKRWKDVKPTSFLSKISFTRYLELNPDGKGFKKMYQWTWMDKLAVKDNSFFIHLNGMGTPHLWEIIKNYKFSEPVNKKLYQIINAYSDFLNKVMDPKIRRMNKKLEE